MKILFLCHRLPYPPKRGGKIRPFNMIRHLGRNHEVTVATLARTAGELAEGRELEQHCHELHVARIPAYAAWGRFVFHALTGYPSTFGYFYSPELARTVSRLLDTRHFDAILVHCSSMGPYVASHRGCRRIMDFGDADSEKWREYARRGVGPRAWVHHLEARRLGQYEQALLARAALVIVSAEREAALLEPSTGGRPDTLSFLASIRRGWGGVCSWRIFLCGGSSAVKELGRHCWLRWRALQCRNIATECNGKYWTGMRKRSPCTSLWERSSGTDGDRCR